MAAHWMVDLHQGGTHVEKGKATNPPNNLENGNIIYKHKCHLFHELLLLETQPCFHLLAEQVVNCAVEESAISQSGVAATLHTGHSTSDFADNDLTTQCVS